MRRGTGIPIGIVRRGLAQKQPLWRGFAGCGSPSCGSDDKQAPATTTPKDNMEDKAAQMRQPAQDPAAEATEAMKHCVQMLQAYDFESSLIAHHFPRGARSSLVAVRAWNAEVARIRDAVTDVGSGRLKMQWWREALRAMYSGQRIPTPVAVCLGNAVHRHHLNFEFFDSILQGREDDLQLEQKQPESMEDVLRYCDQVHASLVHLSFQTLQVPQSEATNRAAVLLGRLQGLTNVLRSLPHVAANGLVPIPKDVTQKHDTNRKPFLKGESSEEVKACTREIHDLAHDILEQLRAPALKSELPSECLPALLYTVPCERYLSRLQAVDMNPFHESLLQWRSQQWQLLLRVRLFGWTRRY